MSDTILWYATRGAGVVSLVLLTAVVVLGIVSAMRMRQPPEGGVPAIAMSPPRLTSTPPTPTAARAVRAARSAARAFPVEPRSSSTPAGNSTVRDCGSKRIACQPGTRQARHFTSC